MPQEELERDIFATGFYRQKAKSLRGTMRMLLEEFDGEVPRTLDELVRLPGVARKTANVVAAELGEPQGIVVDTHVRRLSQRLGFTQQEDPVKIERDLVQLVPREDWGTLPAPPDLARPPRLRSRAGRAARTASSTTSARRAVSDLRSATSRSFDGRRRCTSGGRPDYPAAAIALDRRAARAAPGARVLDLAAGTGKLTRLLVASGATSSPSSRVREMLQRARGGACRRREALERTAERIPLPDGSSTRRTVGPGVPLVRPRARRCRELHRVLRPGGGLALALELVGRARSAAGASSARSSATRVTALRRGGAARRTLVPRARSHGGRKCRGLEHPRPWCRTSRRRACS